MAISEDSRKNPPASLLRCFIAMVYDSFLLFSVLFFAAAIAYPITQGQISLGYQIYLLLVCFLYFAWSWLHGGQTLGMKAWRIRLQSIDGTPVTWRRALLRFSMAIISWLALGIGFLWLIVKQQTWHDWASDTRIVLCPKKVSR